MNKRTILQTVQYSAFPVLMVVKEDQGQKTMHPIPLEMVTLLRWIWLLLTAWSYQGSPVLSRIQMETDWLLKDLGDAFRWVDYNHIIERVTLECKMSVILSRQLVLGMIRM
ncbi:MAG: hypothetical protein AAF485_03220 [Chloroflexota bacterium]